MTDTELSLLAGALLSLVFSYVPGLKEWFDAKDGTVKRLIMLAALVIVTALIFGASCAQLGLPFQVTCDKEGAVGIVLIFLSALAANQTIFLVSPKPATAQALDK